LHAAPAFSGDTVRVQIEIIPDSVNSIRAQLRVEVGTNGRDLMERLSTMEYMDATHRFVTGIAGFKAIPKAREFWKLEINGATSAVGVAEVVIDKPMRIRWGITPY